MTGEDGVRRWLPFLAAVAADALLIWLEWWYPGPVRRHYGAFLALTILILSLTLLALGWALAPRGKPDRAPFLGY